MKQLLFNPFLIFCCMAASASATVSLRKYVARSLAQTMSDSGNIVMTLGYDGGVTSVVTGKP